MGQYFTSTVKLYSTSIFSYAVERGILEIVSKDFVNLLDLFLQDQNLLKTISAPIYSDKEQSQILISAISSLNCCKETINFILLLAKNKRLSLLIKILQHFNLAHKEYLGKKIVEVISSYAMSEKENQELNGQLKKIFAADVELTIKEDPEIIGGLIVKFNNKMFDGSLKTKFEKLTSAVAEEVALL